MKSIVSAICVVLAMIITGAGCSIEGTTFYLSIDGNDDWTGTSEDRPWRSIDRVNQSDFSPGDRILFQGGEEFDGTLILSHEDSGTPERAVTISSYGTGKAILNGGTGQAIWADSCAHLRIEGLELKGAGRKKGSQSDGLLAQQCQGIQINDLDVHGFQKSGVHVRQCHDAVITRVYAHENGFSGIHVTGATMHDPEVYDNHNLYIGYCVAENNPGDPTVLNNHSGNGILASSVRGGTIEYCEAFNNGWDMPWTGNGPVGIWIWDATDVVIQHCIAHHNRTNPVAADGGGFDLDGGVSNCTIQYCLSHNNEGAGFGLYEFGAAKPWENNVVRYNISQDDGIINGGSVGIWKHQDRGRMRNCMIYNNTFYNSKVNGSNIWITDHYKGFYFYNNVFVYNGSFLNGVPDFKEEVFKGNLYWDLDGESEFMGYENLKAWAQACGREMVDGEFSGRFADPLFHKAGSLDITDPEKISRNALQGYAPASGSPLIDAGLDLGKLLGTDPGSFDLTGSPVPANAAYDIGAIERNSDKE